MFLLALSQVMENLNENRRTSRRCERSQPDVACPSGATLKTIEVLGTPITCCTYGSALELITMLARELRAPAVCPANTHILGEARHNQQAALGLVLVRNALRAEIFLERKA